MRMLFVMTNLKSGGVSTSLINLLTELNAHNYDVDIDLLLFDPVGKIDQLPKSVHVIKANALLSLISKSNKELLNESKFLFLMKIVLAGWTKIFGDKVPYALMCGFGPKLEGYDVAISCTQSSPKNQFYGCCNEYVLNSVKSKQKITFVHCDFQEYGLNNPYSKKVYKQFDKIACVSDSCTDLFVRCNPELKNRTFTVYNCHNFGKIIDLSLENFDIPKNNKLLKIVSVSRIGPEKGHIRLINVIKRLNSEGLEFEWHIVGDGNESITNELHRSLEKNHIIDNCVFYGNQDNPYKILKNMDALLVMSLHECAPMVFSEAYALGIPVLTTKTLSAVELVQKDGYGLVCENSEDGLYNLLKSVISEPATLSNCKRNIMDSFKSSNANAIEQFWRMIND